MSKRKFIEASNDNAQITKQAKILHEDVLSDDRTLKYDFKISLEKVAVLKIVSSLWMNENIQTEIVNLFHHGIKLGWDYFKDDWLPIENNVVIKVSELLLPDVVSKKLTNAVPLVGNSLLNWITYHDKYVFDTTRRSSYYAVDQMNYIKWTTRGNIDYSQTAKNILSDEHNFISDDHKYKLACTNCLEDEIAVLAPVVLCQNYLDNVRIDSHPMVYFWTAHISGDNMELYDALKQFRRRNDSNLSINERVFKLLTKNYCCIKRTFNEVPIRYMWNKLSEEEKIENIPELIKELGNQDLRYFLLSNLDYEQQRVVFQECSDVILCDILNDWLWGDYFLSTAFHVLDIMNPQGYLCILSEIIEEIEKYQEDKHLCNECKFIFKQLWQKSSQHLKDFVFENENGHSLEELIFSLSSKEHLDLIKLLFNDLKTQQKKDIIFGKNGVAHCVHLIKTDRWDLLEQFIECTLFSEEDKIGLKRRLQSWARYEIAEYFLKDNNYDKLEQFMSYTLMSEEEKKDFKKCLAYNSVCDDKLDYISINNKIDFTELNNHFNWCASNDPSIVSTLKADIPMLYHTVISELIEEDKDELLDEFLNWCFMNNKQKIDQFKCDMNVYNL